MSRSPLPAATAIVLAGGRSSRFGRDKLAEAVGGTTLLNQAVRGVAPVVSEILVIVSPDAAPPDLRPLERPDPPAIRIITDPEPFGGPLVAMLAGLEQAAEPFALIAGGDMPSLATDVLGLQLRALDAASDVDAACLRFRGRRQPLPLAVRVGVATEAARRLVARGERSLQSLLDVVRARPLEEMEWRPLDPAAATLRDVDRPGDLPA